MDISLTTVASQAMTKRQRREVIELCSHAYQVDYAPFLAAFADPVHVLGSLRGRLVSHALWITRWLRIGNGPLLRTAYIEGVATHADFRGQGYATAVLQHLLGQLAGFDVTALSPATYGLYSRLGWRLWEGPRFVRTDHGLLPTPEEEVMVRTLAGSSPLDWHAAVSIEWRQGEVW